jgi:hypothetical protein
MLAFEPRSADPQPRSPPREDVQSRHLLHEDGRVPIGDARDQRAERYAFGDTGEVGQRRVALEHVEVGLADHRQLEEVIHHPQGMKACVFCGAGDVREHLTVVVR